MLYSRATAAVELGLRLQTATSETSVWLRRPGMCLKRVFAPAPISPTRRGTCAMDSSDTTHLRTMSTTPFISRGLYKNKEGPRLEPRALSADFITGNERHYRCGLSHFISLMGPESLSPCAMASAGFM